MSPSFYIALRFIISRKRALLFSMIGVVCGVAFFICTQAQTRGFEKYFIDTVLGSSGAIVISDRFQERYTKFSNIDENALVSGNQKSRKFYDGITDPYRIMRVARTFSNVLAAAPVVRGTSSASSGFQNEIIRLEGIDLRYHLATTTLKDQIIAGSIENFQSNPYSIMIGSLLAEKLGGVKVGDTLTLTGKKENKVFVIGAIFRSGINVIDESRGYVHIKTAQSLLGRPSDASIIIVRLRDADRAPQLADQFERLFNHRAREWQIREQGNLAIFATLRVSAAITVSLIILLAGFGIFNVLTLTVLDKLREIAILRSMGYQRGDIQAIFLWQGFIIALLGSFFGCILGAGLTYAISLIPLKIRGIIYTDHFIVDWSWQHYAYGTAIAFVAVLIATYFPARRAASVPPVDILRGAGQ